MGVPGRTASWAIVVTFALLATGVGIFSAATATPRLAARAAPTTTLQGSAPESSITAPPSPSTTVPSQSEGIVQVAFFNGSDGYGLFSEQDQATCVLAVAPTNDGGVTFSPRVRLPATAQCSEVSSISFDDEGDGFVFRPGLFVTHDAGRTWTQLHPPGVVLAVVPLGPSVWMLLATCPSTDPSASCGLSMEQSTDGGRTWEAVGGGFGGAQVNEEVANGEAEAFGASWLVRTSMTSAWVTVVPPLGTVSLLPVMLLRTTDGGRTWTEQPSPCSLDWVSLMSEAPDGSLWLACAFEPSAGSQLKAVVRSVDGGRNWLQSRCSVSVTSPTLPPCLTTNGLTSGYLGALVAVSSTTAFIAGGRNFVESTHDGGETWALTKPVIGDGDRTTGGLFFANTQDGWAISGVDNPTSVLSSTTDGGISWSQVWVPPTPPSELVPALQTHNPMVTVSPSTNLTNGQQVEVRVTGFGIGGKVWLSECADAADVNDLGCGHQLPQQTFLVTADTGSGSATFQVMSSAAPKPYDDAETDLAPCVDNCVLVATLGGGYGFAYASVHFAGGE